MRREWKDFWQRHGTHLLSGYYKGSDVGIMYNVGLYGSQFAQPMNNMYVWAWCIDKHIEYGMHAYKYRLISLYICLIWCTGFSRCIEPAKEKNWNHLEPYSFNFSSFFFFLFRVGEKLRWHIAGYLLMFMRVRLWVFLYFLFLLLNAHCSPSRFGRKIIPQTLDYWRGKTRGEHEWPVWGWPTISKRMKISLSSHLNPPD